jgi:hypothetical protein
MTTPGYGPKPTSQGVRGYRDLPADRIHLINRLKLWEEDLAVVWGEVERDPDTDPRWLDIARNHFQEGFSALVRSIARPYDPFQAAFNENLRDEAEGAIPRRDPNAYRRTR